MKNDQGTLFNWVTYILPACSCACASQQSLLTRHCLHALYATLRVRPGIFTVISNIYRKGFTRTT